MIAKVWNEGRVLYKLPSHDGLFELAIGGHLDNGGTICLTQEDAAIVIAPEAMDELFQMLRALKKKALDARERKK